MFRRLVEGVARSVELFHHRLALRRVGEIGDAVFQNLGSIGVLGLKRCKEKELA